MRTFSLAALLMLSASTEAMVSGQNLLQYVQEYEFGQTGHVSVQVEEPVVTTNAVQVGSTNTQVGATVKPQMNVTPVTALAQDVEAEDDLSDAVQDLSDEVAALATEIDELSNQVDALDDDDDDDQVLIADNSGVENDSEQIVAGVSVDADQSESNDSSDPSQNTNSDGISSSDLPAGMMVTADGEIVPMNTVLEDNNGNTVVLDTTGVTYNADPCNTILNDTGDMTADQIAAMLTASGC